jgi:DNA primase
MAFDGDEAGRKAAHRAARLALPGLKPGHSLRFAFLPAGEDPDSLIRNSGAAAMGKVLEAAEPLSEVLWRGETEGHDFSTPERRAGLERALADIVALIADGKIADYYRRDFENRVFDTFKRRAPRAAQGATQVGRGGRAQPESVSPAVKNSAIARTGAVKVKEAEVLRLILEQPELAGRYAEILAALPFSDPFLDRLRQELLNVAASGFGLESKGLENHLSRHGMADLVERLKAPKARSETALGSALGEDADARFLRAASQLREMAELDPERKRALERFNREPNEETDLEHLRLLRGRSGE